MKRFVIIIMIFTSLFSLFASEGSLPIASSETQINLSLKEINDIVFGFADEPITDDVMRDYESKSRINFSAIENIDEDNSGLYGQAIFYIYYNVQSDEEFTLYIESEPLLSEAISNEGDGDRDVESTLTNILWYANVTPVSEIMTLENNIFGWQDYERRAVYSHHPEYSIANTGLIRIEIITEDLSYKPVSRYGADFILTLVSEEGGNA